MRTILLWILVSLTLASGCSQTTGADGGPTDTMSADAAGDVACTSGTLCSGSCVSLATDPANCGACGQACATGSTCDAGVCTTNCSSGQISCGGVCTNTASDPANCGTCGHACASGQSCTAGQCSNPCASGTTLCSGRCYDLMTNSAHCGSCTTVCPSGDTCSNGRCVTPASLCGNGHIDPGETCDGNCPTSCPASNMPCIENVLIGSASTCNAQCVPSMIVGCTPPGPCPMNGTPSMQVGQGVFTGSFVSEMVGNVPSGLTSSGCYPGGATVIYAWQAPADGVYTFSDTGTYIYQDMGQVYTWPESAYVIVGTGASCTSASWPMCPFPGNPHPITLTLMAGQQVLVAASFLTNCSSSNDPTCMFQTANFSIDVSQCIPMCGGRMCGDDGCGGSCGSCPSGQSCTSAGMCACIPSCGGRACGSDGCGGSCGTCPMGSACDGSGQCVCAPSCGSAVCGSDGCGGSCGTCSLGTSCSNGTCVNDPNACDPVSNVGCSAPNGCQLTATEQTECVATGSGTQGSACATSADCAGGYACFAQVCRKICSVSMQTGCAVGYSCGMVSGWTQYGACG